MDSNRVYAAINAVQADLAIAGISKERNNAQHGYKFRGIDDMYNAIAPLLAKHKLCILPSFAERVVTERTTKNGGALFYTNVAGTFTFVSAEDGSAHAVGPFYGEAMDSGDKSTNKAQSAAFKYMAMQTFCIPTDADNDADATTHEVAAKALDPARPNTATQVAHDAFDLLPQYRQEELRDQARSIIHLHEIKGDVYGYVLAQEYDTEAKLALWSLLPSPVRTNIEKARLAAALAAKAPKPHLAEQA